ncbi:hypothetical protein Tco_0767861 [Tanacetum coccineum]
MVVTEGIKLEWENTKDDIASMVAEAVESFLRNYMNNNILHVHPTQSTSLSILDIQQQLYLKIKDDKQARDADFPLWLALAYNRDHEDDHDDNARTEGESSVKRRIMFEESTYIRGTDDDEVPFEEVSPEVMIEISGKGMKSGLTIDDLKQMKDALNDMMRIRCNSGEEHQDHLDQIKSYMENPNAPPLVLVKKDLFNLKNGNSKIRKYILSLHKIHAFLFPENDLKEMNTRWVKRPIQRFNLYARYDIDHWKSLWDPVEYNQGYGQEYMKEIVVKRADGEYKSFIESDYEYLHKNGIEDMYLMCMDVHDYQLELESYQVKVNLTAPNLIFPSIEEKKLYTITSLPLVGLIYENSKKEKRIMDIDEIPKFCDATLKRLLKAVKKIN